MKPDKAVIWLASLGILMLALALFARLFMSGLIIAHGDTFTYFYPYWDAAGKALRAGRFPLWNDLLFVGAPFLANSQVGLLYPPNWAAWLLFPDTPTAVRMSILLHLLWAGLGAYTLLRAPLKLSPLAALSGAALFAGGGHLAAHIEQLNQLQGLAWLPWLFLLFLLARTRAGLWLPLLIAALACQFLTGHTQTVFISIVGIGILAAWMAWRSQETPLRERLAPLLLLATAGFGALILAAPQFLPTLELSGLSNRSGGLLPGDTVAFSLPPALIGRALLPGYDVAVHNEYLATIGLAGAILAVIGAWGVRRESYSWQGWIVLAVFSFFLALGKWGGMYAILGQLPGFNLFRVPARWMALWALSSSVLAAFAVDRLRSGQMATGRQIRIAVVIVGLALIAATFFSTQSGESILSGMELPSAIAVLGWGVTLGLAVIILWLAPVKWSGLLLILLALGELLIASQKMTYNRLTSPDAFSVTRQSIPIILNQQQNHERPFRRYLSISQIMFGPVDQPALEVAYRDQLSAEAVYDLLIASKLKDVIAPNLNMIWGLPGVDGFDGGLLPLRTYTQFSRLLLDNPPPDGRLREYLTAVPEQRWLDLLGVEYLLTDRMNDRQAGGIHFDETWAISLEAGQTITIADLPDFEATGLALLIEAIPGGQSGAPIGEAVVTSEGGRFEAVIDNAASGAGESDPLVLLRWDAPLTASEVQLTGAGSGFILHGAALYNEQDGASYNLIIAPGGRWQRTDIGDVKLYRNQDVPPLARLIGRAEIVTDEEAALARMREAAFNPAQRLILAGGEPLESEGGGEVTLTAYAPEQLAFAIRAAADSYLLVSQAHYPGWTATLDGQPAPIHRADILLQAIYIPAGEHTLTLQYAPSSWPAALITGMAGWLLLAAWMLVILVRRSLRKVSFRLASNRHRAI